MNRVRAALVALVLALGVLLSPALAFAAVGDVFTEPITIGNEQVACTFKVTGSNTVSVGEGGFDLRDGGYQYYSVQSASSALPTATTILDNDDVYVLDAAGSLTIPSTIRHGSITYTVTSIAAGAFYDGAGITSVTIPESVTSLGEGAFCDCTALASINIPASITAIPDYCFAGCAALRTIDGAANVTSIGASAYRACNALHSVTIPSKVSTIGAYAFFNCKALVDVTMSDAVTSLGSYAFAWDDALETIRLSKGLATLPSHLFMQDYNLATIENTAQVTSMGEYIFYSCTNLRSFTIPSAMTTIPKSAFEGSGLSSITIPDSVGLIDESAFCDCSNLQSVTFPSSGACKLAFMAFARCTALETLDLSHVSELMATNYGYGSFFSGCTGLASVTIGSLIKEIPDDAFSSCTALTSITFPSQVTTLGDDAFHGCTGLNAVTIPATLTSLHYESFSDCYGLTALVLEGDSVKSMDGTWSSTYEYEFTKGFCRTYVPDALVDAYKASAAWSQMADYILPMSQKPSDTRIYALLKTDGTLVQCDASGKALSGGRTFIVSDDDRGDVRSDYAKYAITDVKFQSGVTELPDGAFIYCGALRQVSLPSSVTAIGKRAFYECKALQSVSGSNVTTVMYQAFYECQALRDVGFMGKVTELGGYAFDGCSALPAANLNPSLQEVSAGAFRSCTNLSQVTLPTNSTYLAIEQDAFSGCRALTSINLPAQLAYLRTDAFSYTGLTSVSVPSVLFECGTGVFRQCRHLTSAHVRATGDYVQNSMFAECAALRSVTLEDSVTTIQGSVFKGCQALQQIDLSHVTEITSHAFQGCSGLWELELPAGLRELDAAFHDCTGIVEVSLPGGLGYVGSAQSGNDSYGAFSNCTGLSNVTFGEGYEANIGGSMFAGCTALRRIQIPDAVSSLDERAFGNCFLLKDLHLPTSLTAMGSDCFMMCTSLEEVDVPAAGVLSLEIYPSGGQFEGCTRLARITLPDGLDSIAPGMFYHCDSLTEISIPSSVEYVGQMAFRECSNLQTVIFQNDCSTCSFVSDEDYAEQYRIFGACDALSTVVFRERKPQDGVVTFASNPTIYYTVRYYPTQEHVSDRGNVIGQLTVKAGTNVMGTSAPASASIYDGAWIQATEAEPAINATRISDSGWAIPGQWTGVLFVTQPKSGDSPDGSFTLKAEARVRRISGGSASDVSGDVSYEWYACDAAGTISGNAIGTSSTLNLTNLSEGAHYFICVAKSTASGINSPTARSVVACVAVKSGRLSCDPASISYRWPVSDSTKGYGPTIKISNDSSFTVKHITWKSKNGYFTVGYSSGDWGDLDAGRSFTTTLYPNVPDAQAKDYTDTLIISSSNALTLEVPVTLKFFDTSGPYADFSYNSATGTVHDTIVDFGSLAAGYSNPQDNYGIQCTVYAMNGGLTFTGRTSPKNFTIYNESISSYPKDVSANSGFGLKIAPKAGLAAGTYEDSYTYSFKDASGKKGELTITLRVKVRGAGGISVSPTSCTWSDAREGYGAQTAKTITVTNSEETAITLPANTGSSLKYFEVQGAANLSIPAGQSKTFTVAPKTGLAAGSYSEKLTVAPSGVSSKSVTLSFKVTEKPAQSITAANLRVQVGATASIGATTSGDGTLTFESDAPEVATIDASGTVQGVAEGTARVTITASETANYKAATKTITVKVTADEPVTTDRWKRLTGAGRYDTMAEIVREGFATSDVAVLATGTDFPDALVASSVAGALGCPVVLTKSTALSPQAQECLTTLGVSQVYVMGGNSAVSDDVLAQLAQLGIGSERVAGSNRQMTSLKALEWLNERGAYCGTVVVATGKNFADALAIGPWCYANGVPILLTSVKGNLRDEQLEAMAGAERVVVVGGVGAVPQETEDRIEQSLGIEVERIAGSDRYATAALIIDLELADGMTLQHVAVATGKNFPDALAGAALCGHKNAVLALTKDKSASASEYPGLAGITPRLDAEVELGYLLGGSTAVSETLEAYLRELAW